MKVLISGYWNNNLGDDLFLKIISQHYPKHDFYIIAGKKAFDSFNGIKNIHQVSIPLSVKVLNKLMVTCHLDSSKLLANFQLKIMNNFKAYCEVGGSLFILPQEGMGRQYNLRQKITHLDLPYYVIGSNFGPYFSNEQVSNYRRLFKSINHVTFRDKNSYELFSGLNNISYAPDLVFNLDTSSFNVSEDYTLISVINPKEHFNERITKNYFQYLEKVIQNLLRQGEHVMLMSFCEAEGDLQAANKLKEKFDTSAVQIFNHTSINKSLKVISKAKKIITSRYHAMILAWLFNKPTFVMSYSKKIDNVVQDLFPQQPYVDIEYLNQKFQMPTFDVNDNVESIVEKSKGQFLALDSFLNDEVD